jgi:hypothetical protein
MFLPVLIHGSAGNGLATISGPEWPFRNRGIGRSASACPLKLAISGQFILQIHGPSRSGRSWIRRSADCICVSNPAIDRSFHGPSVPEGVTFSPNVKVGYDITKAVNAGFEYYGSLGPITGFDPLQQQQQQIFAVTDLNVSPKWEFNFGVGVGLTGGSDHLLVKMIIGRRVTTS